jgi:hypothetical protein
MQPCFSGHAWHFPHDVSRSEHAVTTIDCLPFLNVSSHSHNDFPLLVCPHTQSTSSPYVQYLLQLVMFQSKADACTIVVWCTISIQLGCVLRLVRFPATLHLEHIQTTHLLIGYFHVFIFTHGLHHSPVFECQLCIRISSYIFATWFDMHSLLGKGAFL